LHIGWLVVGCKQWQGYGGLLVRLEFAQKHQSQRERGNPQTNWYDYHRFFDRDVYDSDKQQP